MKQLSILLLLAGMISCEKLTPITEKGRNTMSCKIDGKVFVAEKIFTVPAIETPTVEYYNGRIRLHGGENPKRKGLQRSVNMEVYNIFSEGTYKFDGLNLAEGFVQIKSTAEIKSFTTDSIHSGILKINKIDTITKVISGTFNFKAKSFLHSKNEVNSLPDVNVTNGRFDIKYH